MPRDSAKAILPVLETKHDGFDRAFAKLVRRREEVQDDVTKTVHRIVDRVREVGDARCARSRASSTARASRSSR
jgi:vacuolar-type H+-ATPase subunit D/Vma8